MPKKCQVTGKKPLYGNNVSHANNKTRRRFLPNLHRRRIWVPSEERYVTLRLSTRAWRTIGKLDIETVLKRMKNSKSRNSEK